MSDSESVSGQQDIHYLQAPAQYTVDYPVNPQHSFITQTGYVSEDNSSQTMDLHALLKRQMDLEEKRYQADLKSLN